MTDEEKRELDAQISAAFARGTSRDERGRAVHLDKDALNAQTAQAAQEVYRLTRALGLERQLMADAPAWKPPAGIAPNAFAKRYFSGIMREECEAYGIPVPASFPYRVMTTTKRARKAPRTACPHCGGSLKEAA